ncbi:outer membrane efflux protein [Azoarcus olearius]|uniref:TolC family protein n=1 Tax=Azoarcus sp. (strain BH72) TaxID=418699 RepID=UPI00080612D0|nr:TolC family protein [Azoarcus olearius]ANQ86116.1 outer membrane efflux protein [Azoarcus olearius]
MKYRFGATSIKRLAALLLLALAGGGPAFADAPALGASVPGLLEHARLNNPAFAAERAEAQAARERIESAGALPDPSFQVELMDFTNRMNGGKTTLVPGQVGETRYRVIQPLPAWGKRELDSRAAEARAGKADAARDAAWVTLAADIKMAWLRYYASDREARLNRDALALLQGLEETTLSRYRLGLLPQQAVLRAQREITAQRLTQVAVEQKRSAAAAALNALLARPATDALAAPLDPTPLPETPQFATLLERVRAANPELAAEALGTDVARLERDRAWRDRYPDWSVGLTNNRPRDGENSWDLMVEVMIPLQQSARRAREREAEQMVTAADMRRSAAEQRLQGELGRSHAAYAAGRETLRLLKGSLLPQAEATRDATRSAFANGRVDFDTVIEAERQLIDIRMRALETEVETRSALAELEKLAGEVQ